jgi:cell pole-organizing protein PopZ
MNAPISSSSDRDLEALRRAQRAHEPSMEEILASIRSIIADDREPPSSNAPVQKPAAPQIVVANDSGSPVRSAGSSAPAPQVLPSASVVVLPVAENEAPIAAEVVSPPSFSAPAASTPKVVWEKPAPVVEAPAPQRIKTPPEPVEEEPFSSPETEAAVAASFSALSATIAMQSSETIEGMMREMLRPMLKSWLDDNLPSLVERLVRAEIQRVARGGR